MRHAFILAIGLGVLCVGAPARAEDNPACAKYEEPLAYNACLARLGPSATGAIAAPDGESGGPRADGRRRAHGGLEISRERRGRERMEFDVGGKRRRP
ncbi:MAG: hypothetical protein ABSA66_15255 [Roseiarcus sp.]|jgi:hypothetical protein